MHWLMDVAGATFEENSSNISEHFPCYVICFPLKPLMTSSGFTENVQYVLNDRRYNQKCKQDVSFLKNVFQTSFNYIFFHFIDT